MTTQPSPDPGEYRRLMGRFATGVTVILAGDSTDARGMTANSVTSLSLTPLLVLFCVDKKARFLEALREHANFTINILQREQEALSTWFAGFQSDAAPPQFELVPWQNSTRLGGCPAVACQVEQFLEGGDHWIVIGRVLALHHQENTGNPLIYFGGKYRSLQP